MDNYKYKYVVADHGMTLEDATEFGSNHDDRVCPNGVASDAGEHFHYHGNGLDCDWPLVFEIYSVTNYSMGRFEVSRIAVPEFAASRVKDLPDKVS